VARTKPLDSLVARARARRRRRRLTGAAAVTAVLVAGSAVAAYELPSRPGRTVTASAPPSTAPSTAPATDGTPSGYHRVDYNNASLAVPGAWGVIPPGIHECPTPDNGQVVLLGDADTTRVCGGTKQEPLISYARLSALPTGKLPAGKPVVINGHRGSELLAGPGTRSYLFPDLRVELTVAGPDAANITETLGWSGAYPLLHPANPVQVPKGWREVSVEGVTVRIPSNWPVIDLGSTQYMPGVCRPEFFTPVIDVGPGGSTPCAGPQFTSQAQTDGVWIRPHPETVVFSPTPHVTKVFPPPGSVLVRREPIPVVVLPHVDNRQHVVQLAALGHTGDQVAIDIGLAPDPTTAQEILASIS
jgi:hypothetical protein